MIAWRPCIAGILGAAALVAGLCTSVQAASDKKDAPSISAPHAILIEAKQGSVLFEQDADTLIYPGHDYLANNLGFTLDREPDNKTAKRMIEDYRDQDPADALVTTLALERDMNTFFRLDSPTVIARLVERFPEIGDHPDPRTVFLKLRELRNAW